MPYKINNLVDKIISNNVTERPFEGQEVDTYGLKESIISLCENISIGFFTWCNKNATLDKKRGYLYKGRYYSKKDLFDIFIQSI